MSAPAQAAPRLPERQVHVLHKLAGLSSESSYASTGYLRPDGMNTAQTNRCLHALRRRGLAKPHPMNTWSVYLWGITEAGRALAKELANA